MTTIDEAMAHLKAEAAKIESETLKRMDALCEALAKDLRMAAEGWIKHDPSKGMPVRTEDIVLVCFEEEASRRRENVARAFDWTSDAPRAIAYYRVLATADAPAPEPEAGPWKPKEGDEYFYLSPGGFVSARFCYDHTLDQQLYAVGNCFPTREGAEHARKRRILAADHERAAEVDRAKNARGFYRFCIVYDDGDFDFGFQVAPWSKRRCPNVPMFHTEAAAQAFLDEHRADFDRLHGEGV